MSARLVLLVAAITETWLRIYTWRVPRDVAAVRQAEIESDLWEMQHDADLTPMVRLATALQRLFEGIPDDLAWRLENVALEEQLLMRRVFALAAAMAVVLSLLTMPSFFFKDRRDIATCAAEIAPPPDSATYSLEVMRCAGAFFASQR